MDIFGHVKDGVVVLDEGAKLPEGTRVAVCPVPMAQPDAQRERKRVEFPLSRAGEPGSVHLTNERIYEIIEEEDVAALKSIWNAPPRY